jgi:hypothetical protein
MRRSSSGARVSEGGIVEAAPALPTYDPTSAAGRREAARVRGLGRAVHCIPVVLLLCALVLWLSASTATPHAHRGRVQTHLLWRQVLLPFPIFSRTDPTANLLAVFPQMKLFLSQHRVGRKRKKSVGNISEGPNYMWTNYAKLAT